MKWLKVITIGLVLLVLSSSIGFSADVPDFYPISGCQQLTDRQWALMVLGTIDTSYPFYKGLKTWTEKRYKYVEKPLWFDIFGSWHYKTLASKDIHRYDKAGLETEWYSYDKGHPDFVFSTDRESKSTYDYQYNDQGKLIAMLEYDADGVLDKKTVIKHDQQGNKIEQILHYVKAGKQQIRESYKYDETGNGFEHTQYSSNREGEEKMTGRSINKFDKQGRLIESVLYKKDRKSVKYRQTYKYVDEKNSMQSKTYNADGKLTNTRNYRRDIFGDEIPSGCIDKYDQQGNKVERAWMNESHRPFRKMTYKYDNKNNLTEKSDYKVIQQDGKDVAIIKEQITHEYEFYPEDKETEEPAKK